MFRSLLLVFVGSLGIATLFLLGSILSAGGLSDGPETIMLLALAVSVGSGFLLGALAVARQPRFKPLAIISALLTGFAFLVIVRLIFASRVSEKEHEFAWSFVTIAAGVALICAMLLIRLLDQWRVVRAATFFALALLVISLVTMMNEEGRSSSGLRRVTGVGAVLFTAGTVLVLVGRSLSRKAFLADELEATVLRCPHCGGELPRDLAEVFH